MYCLHIVQGEFVWLVLELAMWCAVVNCMLIVVVEGVVEGVVDWYRSV
jgi:hypothetical protein